MWGVIALPLLARMYVRAKDLPAIYPQHRPEFQTKLEMAVESATMGVRQGPIPEAGDVAGDDGCESVAQGRGAVDSAGPPRGRAAQQAADLRGKPYRADQTSRAASRLDDRGLRPLRQAGEEAVQNVEATWRPAGGLIRVVLVDECA